MLCVHILNTRLPTIKYTLTYKISHLNLSSDKKKGLPCFVISLLLKIERNEKPKITQVHFLNEKRTGNNF